jgi:hypothetical protein
VEKVVCVLRGGGEYTPEHVYTLKKMVDEHLGLPFYCLSDQPLDCSYLPMAQKWPKWWAKMELFRLRPPVLYLDLDTIIRGTPTFLDEMRSKDFVIMRDVYRGKRDHKAMQSSIMYWQIDMTWLYDRYMEQPEFKNPGGDQSYIEQNVRAEYFQDFTNEVVSYKADICKRGPLNSDKVVIFHGQPRPWEQEILPY